MGSRAAAAVRSELPRGCVVHTSKPGYTAYFVSPASPSFFLTLPYSSFADRDHKVFSCSQFKHTVLLSDQISSCRVEEMHLYLPSFSLNV